MQKDVTNLAADIRRRQWRKKGAETEKDGSRNQSESMDQYSTMTEQ